MRYLTKSYKIQLNKALKKNKIEILPQAEFNNITEFRKLFDENKNNTGILKTPIGEVRVNTIYALNHFTNNTYFKDRANIKGGFFETFKNPLFVVEDTSKGKDSVYFYKPFLDEDNNILSLFGIGIDGVDIDSSGKVDFTTFYKDISGSRFKEMLGLKDENVIYIKEQIAPRYHNHYTDNEFELIATISGVGLKARLAMSDYARILPQKNFKVKFKGKIKTKI